MFAWVGGKEVWVIFDSQFPRDNEPRFRLIIGSPVWLSPNRAGGQKEYAEFLLLCLVLEIVMDFLRSGLTYSTFFAAAARTGNATNKREKIRAD